LCLDFKVKYYGVGGKEEISNTQRALLELQAIRSNTRSCCLAFVKGIVHANNKTDGCKSFSTFIDVLNFIAGCCLTYVRGIVRVNPQ
jgi:hypothetical protein